MLTLILSDPWAPVTLPEKVPGDCPENAAYELAVSVNGAVVITPLPDALVGNM